MCCGRRRVFYLRPRVKLYYKSSRAVASLSVIHKSPPCRRVTRTRPVRSRIVPHKGYVTRRILVVVWSLMAIAGFALVATSASGKVQGTPQDTTVADTAYEAPEITDTAGLAGPRQPIFFRHDRHAGQYLIDCQYCHVNLEISPKPGIPTVGSCLNCHLIVGTGIAEVDSLRGYEREGRAIEWVEVHDLAQFVHFPHQVHVNAEEDFEVVCEDCHGQVDRMTQIYQFAPLKMGWCLDCHEQKAAEFDKPVSTDCSVCHY